MQLSRPSQNTSGLTFRNNTNLTTVRLTPRPLPDLSFFGAPNSPEISSTSSALVGSPEPLFFPDNQIQIDRVPPPLARRARAENRPVALRATRGPLGPNTRQPERLAALNDLTEAFADAQIQAPPVLIPQAIDPDAAPEPAPIRNALLTPQRHPNAPARNVPNRNEADPRSSIKRKLDFE